MQTLLKQTDQLEEFFWRVPYGVTVQDEQGNLVYANLAAARLIGLEKAGEMEKLKLKDLEKKMELKNIDGKKLNWFELPGNMALKSGITQEAIIQFNLLAEGRREWIKVIAEPIKNNLGQVLRVINTYVDVTDSLKLEDRLKLLAEVDTILAEERDYEKGLRHVSRRLTDNWVEWCTICLRDHDGNLKHLVTTHKEIENLKPTATVIEIVNKINKEGPILVKKLDKSSNTVLGLGNREKKVLVDLGVNSLISVPMQIRNQEIGRIYLMCFNKPYIFETEDMEYAQEIANKAAAQINNILLVRRLENENRWRRDYQRVIEDSEKKFRSVFDSATEAMVIVDDDRVCMDANPAAFALFELPAKNLFGKILPGFGGKEWDEKWKKLHDEGVMRGEMELEIRNKNETRIIEYSTSIDFIPNRHLFMLRDITEYRREEKRKDDFLGVASHEMKTPLAVIKAYAQLLQKNYKSWGDEKIGQYLNKIEANANRLAKIVYDLLDVTRIREGRLEFFDEIFDVDEWAQGVIADMKQVAPDREIVRRGGTKCLINADKARMRQVLTNLIKNGIVYSQAPARVELHLKCEPKHVTIGVKDYGIGISKENMDKLFELFYRGENASEKGASGMGVGLYISNQIVRHYGGKIWVDSKPGRGSTFYFSIPRIVNTK